MSGDEKLTADEEVVAETSPAEPTATDSTPVETEGATPSSTPTDESPAPDAAPAVSTDAAPEATVSGEGVNAPPPAPASEAPPAESTATSEPSTAAEPADAYATSDPGTADAASAAAEATEKRRPKLNPTGADAARAVPNVAGGPASAPSPAPSAAKPAAPAAADSSESTSDESAAQPAEPKAPIRNAPAVDVPRTDELDDALLGEISAAMSTEEKQAEAAAAAAEAAAAAAEEATSEAGESEKDAAAEKAAPAGVTPVSEDELEQGKSLSGKILSIHGDNVFLDIGSRMNGVVTKRQFESNRQPAEGQLIQVVVDKVDNDEGLVHCSLPKGTRRVAGNWDLLSVGQVVECYVNKTNKGGLDVAVSGLRAFLPASQVDLHFVDDMEAYVGQKLRVRVTEVNPKKRNLVVSRRACLIEERKESEKELWQRIAEGQKLEGVVKTIKPYGAFVDIGGTDGFLHVGEISWNHIKDPSEVLQVGQQVDVQILKLDRDAKKISLGMKQLVQNPWSNVGTKYPEGATVTGKVTRTTDFGAFVELEQGVEGLIHISEMDHQRVRKVTDVVHVGRDVEAQVVSVEPKRKRIGLSLKALKEKPVQPSDEDLAPGGGEEYQRKRKGPLKGGTGTTEAGGGLFGNPNDFG